MNTQSAVSGEVSDSKTAAIFDSRAAADASARRLRDELGLADRRVRVVGPRTSNADRHLEPESAGIFRTAIRAHVTFGLVGAVLGALAFAILFARGVPWVVTSPLAAGLAATAFGAVAGLLGGGFYTLRPDHDLYILTVQDALREDRSAVVVHAASIEQRDRARELLERLGGETVVTL